MEYLSEAGASGANSRVECYSWQDLGAWKPHLLQLRRLALSAQGVSAEHLSDVHDVHFHHLLAFDGPELFGAYRIRLHSPGGLMAEGPCAGLFDFSHCTALKQALVAELGRAVIHPEHQRRYGSLLALWRGIARWVGQAPVPEYLVGPVTVPKAFPLGWLPWLSAAAKGAEQGPYGPSWLQRVTPRHALEADQGMRSTHPEPKGNGISAGPLDGAAQADFKALDAALRTHNPDIRVPTLLRQYQRLGASFSEFGRWPAFGQAYVTLACLPWAQARTRILRSSRA